jgi:hypothetical protein
MDWRRLVVPLRCGVSVGALRVDALPAEMSAARSVERLAALEQATAESASRMPRAGGMTRMGAAMTPR